MILCLGTTPAVQRVMLFRRLVIDAVNRASTTLDGAAGKSINVAKVLQTLGASPFATGFLGGDRGEYLRSVLVERSIAHEFVRVSARTRQCITVIDESTGTQTELVEESAAVTAKDVENLMEIVRRRANGCRAVIMSGTIAPGATPDLYLRTIRLAHEAGALSVVDAQGEALMKAFEARPGLVKPNRAELSATVGRELPDDAAVRSAMRELWERGAQRVVVTAGSASTFAFDGVRFWRIAPPAVRVVNAIGSGDAFAAGLVWRLVCGDGLGEACRWGTAAGAANAMTSMAGEVRPEDVERLATDVKAEVQATR